MQSQQQKDTVESLAPKFDASFAKGVRVLLDSYITGLAKGRPVDDFAMEIEELHELGLTKFHLRRLLAEKFIQCGVDQSRPGETHRELCWFPPEAIAFPPACCIRLTPAGVAWARAFVEGSLLALPVQNGRNTPPAFAVMPDGNGAAHWPAPHWHEEDYELWHFGKPLCCIRRDAANIIAILRAFQAAAWPPLIVNSLPYDHRLVRAEHAREAVKKLNRRLRHLGNMLHFYVTDRGDKIGWEMRPPSRNGVTKQG
jgi:hypothetical protein